MHTNESEFVWGMLVMDFERSPLSQRSLHERTKKICACAFISQEHRLIFLCPKRLVVHHQQGCNGSNRSLVIFYYVDLPLLGLPFIIPRTVKFSAAYIIQMLNININIIKAYKMFNS